MWHVLVAITIYFPIYLQKSPTHSTSCINFFFFFFSSWKETSFIQHECNECLVPHCSEWFTHSVWWRLVWGLPQICGLLSCQKPADRPSAQLLLFVSSLSKIFLTHFFFFIAYNNFKLEKKRKCFFWLDIVISILYL